MRREREGAGREISSDGGEVEEGRRVWEKERQEK